MRAKWYFLGCLTSVVIVILLIILSVNSLVKMSKKTQVSKISEDSVLYLKLSGYISEYSTVNDARFQFVPTSAHDIITKIKKAKTDENIESVVIRPEFIVCGYAVANEIRQALNDFKESGKKVYGYINMASQKDIFILSAANKVYINPSASAGFMLHGVGGNFAFYKDMLSKIGVEVHVIRAGKYKAAGESFSRSSMSNEYKENISIMYKDLYDQLVTDLANNYEMSEQNVKFLFEDREEYFVNLEKSKEFNIIDDLQQFDDFLKEIGIKESQLVKLSKYNPSDEKLKFNKIAVVYAQGNIVSNKPSFNEMNINSEQYLKILDDIEKDDTIKAVVLRVNSPGGSALESDIIYHKINKLKEKKPVVVSMSDVAASGGYYISANANYIFADPYTITGSIGVIGMLPDLSQMSQKIGINTETVGYGKFLSSYDMWNAYNKDFERGLQVGINDVYNEFLTRVSEGRNIPYNDVDKIAQGQVWSAKKALEYKLIDEIGSLEDAINKASEIVFENNFSLVYYPQRKNFIEFIMEDNLDFNLMKMAIKNEVPELLLNDTEDYLQIIDEIQNNPIQMRMEYLLDVN